MHKACDAVYWLCSSIVALQIVLLKIASPPPPRKKHPAFTVIPGFPYGMGKLEFHVMGCSSYQQAQPLKRGTADEFAVLLVKFGVYVPL